MVPVLELGANDTLYVVLEVGRAHRLLDLSDPVSFGLELGRVIVITDGFLGSASVCVVGGVGHSATTTDAGLCPRIFTENGPCYRHFSSTCCGKVRCRLCIGWIHSSGGKLGSLLLLQMLLL